MARLEQKGPRTLCLLAILALAVLPAFAGPAAAQDKPQAYVIKIDGPISEAWAKAVERRLDFARQQGVRTVILELNTPGGTVQDSIDLADYVFQADDLDVTAYINTDAFSGGTMVALACKEIYIDGAVGMMGDVAPVGPTGEIAGVKIQTVISEKLASYARARGYPEALARAMVTKELEVFRVQFQDEPEGAYTYMTDADLRTLSEQEAAKIISKRIAVPAGDLLTMDAGRAVELGFAKGTVKDADELYAQLDLDPHQVRRLYLSASERLLTFLDMFSPLFIVGGIVLLYIELTNPGFGAPGILGIACFVTFFIVKWTLNYVRMLELVLFAAGLALLLIEVLFIPGFGVTGITGIALVFISLVLAFQQFGWPRTGGQLVTFEYSLLKATCSFAAAGVAVAVLARCLPSLPVLKRMVHRTTLAAAHAGELGERRTPGLAGMVGAVGLAVTALRPAGRAEFGDTLLDVVTEGDFVPKGARVQIRAVHGSRVVVSPHEER